MSIDAYKQTIEREPNSCVEPARALKARRQIDRKSTPNRQQQQSRQQNQQNAQPNQQTEDAIGQSWAESESQWIVESKQPSCPEKRLAHSCICCYKPKAWRVGTASSQREKGAAQQATIYQTCRLLSTDPSLNSDDWWLTSVRIGCSDSVSKGEGWSGWLPSDGN